LPGEKYPGFFMDQRSVSEIVVSDQDVRIDSHHFTIPVPLQTLKDILGCTPAEFKGKYNTVYTWHELGIRAYSGDKVNVQSLGLDLLKHRKYNFTPSSLYTGKLRIGDQDYTAIRVERKDKSDDSMEITLGVNHIFIDLHESDAIAAIEISAVKAPGPIEDPDRYKFTPIAGEKIEFKDFNFKLAVIQVLMYEKELIKPAFDIFEFAKRYRGREIDVDKEGYDIIPEVREYFEKLEIDKKYAGEITEIIQDGGNDIYMNMIAFWSGEDDVFNIRSFEDTVHFKNLKKVELFYDENIDAIREELRAKGISAELY
jgi:hypothetical protein